MNLCCLICKSNYITKIKNGFGWFYDKFDIYRCESCNTHFIDPTTINEAIYDQIYSSDINSWYIRYDIFSKQVLNKKDPFLWLSNEEIDYMYIYNIIKWMGARRKLKILEVWCWLWYTTYSINKSTNHECLWIDISKVSIDKAINLYGHYYDYQRLENIDNDLYDIVFATEVLEHIADPYDFIVQCFSKLKKWWKLIITTPNKDFRNSKSIRWSDLPPVHISWITTKWLLLLWQSLSSNSEVWSNLSWWDMIKIKKNILIESIMSLCFYKYYNDEIVLKTQRTQDLSLFHKIMKIILLDFWPIRIICNILAKLLFSKNNILCLTIIK